MRGLLAVLLVGIVGCGGQETLTFKGHSGWVHSVSFSPDGKRIVSGGGYRTVFDGLRGVAKVWDISSLDTSK